MLPNREGRFRANIIEHGVAETGPNDLATFICKFGLIQELAGGEWIPVDEDFDITGYFYLEKKDRSINTITVDSLKAAFGWDGRDPLWLQDTDFAAAGLVVQVKLGFEVYNGKQRIKVLFVDAGDATPASVQKADEATRRNLANRLGSKLRALAGGSPAPAPRPTAQPKAPAPRQAPARAAVATVPPELAAPATMEDVWARFSQACGALRTPEQVEAEWFRILGQLFPGKEPKDLTPDEWGLMRDRGIPAINQIKDDDIPF